LKEGNNAKRKIEDGGEKYKEGIVTKRRRNI
jgi:hypothetical protein